ncbi:helix-turn-helix transcriptional regulator [Motiliproteus sediminis]|uniref:helix-turn-helix transcriptional regulator n=1 Tax=Motiliproteus sediminis TaxID=1468178 RepID=UPI001AEF52C1|nr:helix-turn-helix transcriptional regulator [Motiliproteus sediminis]
MDDLKPLLDCIATIYAGPGSDANWRNSVAEVAQLCGAKTGAYFSVNAETLTTEVSAHHGYQADDYDLYTNGYGAKHDIRFQYMHNLIPGQVFREFEFVTDEEGYRNSKWIQFQQERYGVYWCMSAQVSTHRLWRDFIAVNRLESLGPHTDEEKETLGLILPHLSRAAELHRTVTQLESRYGAVLSVLDKLLVGLVLLDRQGRVVVSNEAARRIMEATGAFTVSPQGRLELPSASKSAELAQLIAATGETAEGENRQAGKQLVIPKRSQLGYLLLEAMPLRDDGFSDRDNVRGTALFVIDPEQSEIISTRALVTIFELTSAEADITEQLVGGASVDQIAEQRRSSPQTVRTQLKQVFAKTGARSQADLVRLALKAKPPIK